MVKDVSAQFLAQVVNNEYSRRILEINELTRQTGIEHGFGVYKMLDEDTAVYPVYNEHEKYATGNETSIVIKIDPFFMFHHLTDTNIAYLLLKTHSHPNGTPIPSLGDLKSIAHTRRKYMESSGLNLKPISVVTTNYSQDEDLLSIIMFQEKTDKPLEGNIFYEIESEFLEVFDFRNSPQYIEKVIEGKKYSFLPIDAFFEGTGFYNALSVHFNKRNGLLIPAPELEKFTNVLNL